MNTKAVLAASLCLNVLTLADFDPNEREFRDIFKLRKKFDDEFSLVGTKADSETKTRKEAAALETDRELKKILGDRYPAYRNERDWAFSALRQAAEAEGVPRATAVKVFDIRDAAREQAQKLRHNPALSETQRQTALQAIQTETRSAISEVLGTKASENYFYHPQVTKGWFGELNPSAPKP